MALVSQRYCANCGAGNSPTALFCCSCAQSLKITTPLAQEIVGAASHTVTAHLKAGDLLENRYRIVGQVGTGGFGAVYKVEDTLDHGRLLAVKEIGLVGLTPQQVIEATGAFNREVTLLSDLRHASIPRIYAHFTDPEHWYLVMDFIEGETLEDYRLKSAGACLSLETTLGIGMHLCDVLDYLHRHQPPIIYRDVKPTNVMLTPGGKVYLIDYGVARYYRAGKSRDTIAFGSPGFAAPEQYGKAQTTPRSDIYSLGVTIYQLLTGVDPSLSPFRFPALRVLDASVPDELESLVMQMLEMEVDKRPASMSIVKGELQRIFEQHKSLLEALHPVRQSMPTPAPDALTFSTRGIPRYIYRHHDTAVHCAAWSPDGKRIASTGKDHAVHVWNAFHDIHPFLYREHADVVNSVAWSPDSRRIASASKDQTVHIWDAAPGPGWLRAVAQFTGFRYSVYDGHTGGVNSVAWSPNGRYIASAGDDHAVLVWEATSRSTVTLFQGHAGVQLVAWSPDGRYIASVGMHAMQVWNTQTKEVKFTFRDSSSVINDLCWSPDGKHIVLASSDHTIQIWHVLEHRKIFTYKGHVDRVHAVACSPDGKYIASGGSDQAVHIWEAVYAKPPAQSKPVFIYSRHEGAVLSVAWSPDGQHIASASEDGTVHVWQAM